MTWDAKEKMYKEYVFSGDFPGALVETGSSRATRWFIARRWLPKAQR